MYLEHFQARHLKPDFKIKFVRGFDRTKPITGRFFVKSRERDIAVKFSELFGRLSGRVAATVLWGPVTSPVAFQLEGHGGGLQDILARISHQGDR